jgi:hypothetical protein
MATAKACPTCHDGDSKQLNPGVWLGLAAALIATPLLSRYARCSRCGKVSRSESTGSA